MKIRNEVEGLRQGFADVLNLVIPYVLQKRRREIFQMTFEAYHFNADKVVRELKGKGVYREYKTIPGKKSKEGK